LESNHSSSPVNNQLSELVQDLTKISAYSSTYSDLANRLNSVALELADISKESESCLAKANDGVVDYELSSERLNLINQLEQKHRAHSFSDLLDKFEEIGTRLSKYSQIETTQKNLENSIKALNEELLKQAKVLSKNRATVTEKIEMFIVSTLVDLGMKNGQFKVDLNTRTTLHESGIDEVNFLFSANKGIELQEMSKVASGGESSRLMLAIKALLAKHLALPCLVLDEIDTGVSGEIASKIAKILTEMSKETQLIVISHLPQVAAKATTHYKVEKLDVAGKTQTNIRLLADEQRLDELAKMLSGEKISTAALENAKALMLND
jgi:DNA repair protein RecN (Recombination protein N)